MTGFTLPLLQTDMASDDGIDWSAVRSNLSPEEKKRTKDGDGKQRVIAAVEIIRSLGLDPPSLDTGVWELLERPKRDPKYETIGRYIRQYNLEIKTG